MADAPTITFQPGSAITVHCNAPVRKYPECDTCCAVQALLLPGHTEFEPPCTTFTSPTSNSLSWQHQQPHQPGADPRLHPAVLEASKAVAQRLREAHARKLQVGRLAAWGRISEAGLRWGKLG